MGPGHFGVGLAAKRLAPGAPLWALLLASELIDGLCFAFFGLGIEKGGESAVDLATGMRIITPGVIPWSHGLLMAVAWSLAAGVVGWLALRKRLRAVSAPRTYPGDTTPAVTVWRTAAGAGAAIGLVVFSHWALDFVVHPPDLPVLLAGSPLLGLGLWGSGPGLVASGILEVLLLAGGGWLYWRGRKATSRRAGGMPIKRPA